MPVKLLVKVNETGYKIPDDPDKDRAGGWKTGYIVEQRPDTWVPGGKEVPPKFICVRITDLDDVNQYLTPWHLSINYSIVASNLTIDGHRLRIAAEYPGTSGRGRITRTQVENFLNRWNASVVSTTVNAVTFDVAIFADGSNNPGALQSEGFWEFNPAQLDFTEVSYNQSTGEHQISVDYSVMTAVTPERAEQVVKGRRATILSHDTTNKIIEFISTRNDVREIFQEAVKRAVDKVVYRRQYYLDPTWVQDVCDNQSGYVEVTAAQLATHLGNKLNDNVTTLDSHSLLL